ncbi:MAG: diphosphomevalonate decarboxylase, partial [Anaerolineales bacterium]
MPTRKATAVSCPNIALIKYWGNRDDKLRLPANSSLSMNLAGLETVTTVEFIEGRTEDEVVIAGEVQTGAAKIRVVAHLDHIRARANLNLCARVESRNTFPAGAGIASSASAFAALTLAGVAAAGLTPSERELSALARLGSGSAARSIPGGFVEWQAGESHEDSFAFSIAPPDHWAVVDLVAVVSQKHKVVGSTGGHALANTSPLQAARLASAPERLQRCREAVLARDFLHLADVVEADSNLMHAVMMTSTPPL